MPLLQGDTLFSDERSGLMKMLEGPHESLGHPPIGHTGKLGIQRNRVIQGLAMLRGDGPENCFSYRIS